MPLCLLNKAIILLRTVEIEETRLCTLWHLLEKTHRIALSFHKEEEDGTATNNSDKEEEDKDSNDLSTTLPMHCDRWTINQSQ